MLQQLLSDWQGSVQGSQSLVHWFAGQPRRFRVRGDTLHEWVLLHSGGCYSGKLCRTRLYNATSTQARCSYPAALVQGNDLSKGNVDDNSHKQQCPKPVLSFLTELVLLNIWFDMPFGSLFGFAGRLPD
jgi:hypothetical protein